MKARVENGTVVKQPFTQDDLQAMYPESSVPTVWTTEFMQSEGIVEVVATAQPNFNRLTEKVVEIAAQYSEADGVWLQTWEVVALSNAEKVAAWDEFVSWVVNATYQRLDNFAATKQYDSILSAASYASSSIQRFAVEGQYAVQARDATLDALFSYLDEVVSMTRPAPSAWEDVEQCLPALVWPE